MDIPVLTVLLYATLTALATGLGALPFVFLGEVSERIIGLAYATAGGLMIAASFNLIFEGVERSRLLTVVGGALGLAFLILSRRWLSERDGHEELALGGLRGGSALKALLIVGVMTLHSAAEGIGVGVAFGGGETFGLFVAAAIAVHNIPEGAAISLVLVPQGVSVWRAAGWSIFSSLPQPLLALPAYWFVEQVEPALPLGLGFAAGAMLWMTFSELLSDALEKASAHGVATATTLSILAMVAIQALLGGG